MERTIRIVPKAGLHARPASKFVQAANEQDADVSIGRPGGEAVSAASMLAVTGLNVEHGEEVRVVVENAEDPEATLDSLEAVLQTPIEDEDEG